MSIIKKFIFMIFASLFFGCFHSDEPTSIFKENSNVEKIKENNQNGETYSIPEKTEKKLRIGVIQSDDYPEYYETFTAIVNGLQVMGWLSEDISLNKSNYKSNREFINGIQGKNYSDYIEFVPEAFFSFRADSANKSQSEFKRVMEMAKNNQLDAVILLGTLASSVVLSDPDYKTATIMDAVSDPIGSGFVDSIEDSGRDFLTARLDLKQYVRQVNLFYDVIGFDKLGLIYEDSENGRSYAAVASVEEVSNLKGFELITAHNVMSEPTVKEYGKALKLYLAAMDKICPQVEAMFLGISGGLEPDSLPTVVKSLIDYKLPSFTMEGTPAVKKGVMLGVSGKEAGLYNARKLVQILKGSKPRTLNQNFEKTPKISINLNTAQAIGYDLPVQIIRSADEIYY